MQWMCYIYLYNSAFKHFLFYKINFVLPLNLHQILANLSKFFSFYIFSYEKFLLRAKQEDLADIAQLQCIYQSGVDRFGRPVIVFIGRNLPANCIDMERVSALLFGNCWEKHYY